MQLGSYFSPRVRRKSTLATIGIRAYSLRSSKWRSLETIRSAFPSTAHSRIRLSSGSADSASNLVRVAMCPSGKPE